MKVINDCDSLLGVEKNLSIFTGEFYNRTKYEYLPLRDRSRLPKETKLVIIGSGLAGISIAAKAWHLGFKEKDLVILDENEYFAKQFIERTNNINQKVMRSPYRHHTGPSQDISLSDYVRLNYKTLTHAERHQLHLDRLGERSLPPLDFFISHTMHTVFKHNLHRNAYKFKVKEINKVDNHWLIRDEDNKLIKTKYAILALGGKVSNIELPDLRLPLYNSLSCSLSEYLNDDTQNICVVGSGNTAAHIILSSLIKGKKVNWIIRNEEIYKCTDIPHEYWRDEGLYSFMKLTIPNRELKLQEIFHGSAMLEHFHLFKQFKKRGLLKVHEHTVIEKQIGSNKIKLSNGRVVQGDVVVISNGLIPAKLPLITPEIAIRRNFPVLKDYNLEVEKSVNLYIASTQSALSLGPAAKNIEGARLACDRILIDILKKETEENNLGNKNIAKIRRSFFGTTGAITG
ncbi:FAD-dependent oxidoreductase [Bacillus subtilis]|uniref:FAD-dependent oxidoreductase n=1 Tax=Bacillus subtilis TaxID=1423 RepID=UPI001D089DFD|nr:FAD-dependent oxidoreductase [Bacillus subtilis]MCB7159974.1 FAD-dependent oxidoreductase [Bacillus subtilis]MCB7459028.1 FAD-dependent oxidoreductase [Bacillus subtilis]